MTLTTLLASLSLLASADIALAADTPPPQQTISFAGSQASIKGPAEFFTGDARIDPLFPAKDVTPITGAYVTFHPALGLPGTRIRPGST
jgi:hypothetical protein